MKKKLVPSDIISISIATHFAGGIRGEFNVRRVVPPKQIIKEVAKYIGKDPKSLTIEDVLPLEKLITRLCVEKCLLLIGKDSYKEITKVYMKFNTKGGK
jgi:hypothetical protein